MPFLLTKNFSDTAGRILKIKQNKIIREKEVNLLQVKIDQRLSFDSHISSICKKASKQLSALKKLGGFLNIS